jgi:hypothetical protein
MRPASIVKFQWLYLAYMIVSLLVAVMGWDAMTAQVSADPRTAVLGRAALLGLTALNYVILLLLWYFAAFRASNVARWIATVFLLLAVALAAKSWIGAGFSTSTGNLLATLGLLLDAAAIWMLFRPDAAAWFKGPAA